MNFPLISIIIPTYNRKDKLCRLIESILNSNYPKEKLEIIVVDDASNDGTFETIRDKFLQDNIKVIRNKKNKLVSETRNVGIKNSHGEFLFFVDDDVILTTDTIYKLVLFMKEYRNPSIVGPIIYQFGKPKRIWSAGVKINFWTTYGKFLKEADIKKFGNIIRCDGLPSAFMVHKEIIKKIGLFNSKLFPTGFEELDFCIRASLLGYNVIVIKNAEAFHERKKGIRLHIPHNLYFGTRNRFIAHKLWSKNCFQVFVSQIFSIIFALILLIIKSTLYPKNYILCVKSILIGLWDGIRISFVLTPYIYSLKEGRGIKYEE